MKNASTVLYLKIAGFIYKLHFQKSNTVNSIFIRNSIKSMYHGFVEGDFSGTSDYTIKFIDRTTISFLHDNKKTVYIEIYQIKKPTLIVTNYHISGSQFRLLLRNSMMELLENSGDLMMHCSSVVLKKNVASLFFGNEGMGKSTVVNMLKSHYMPLADDSGIVRYINKRFYFYQNMMVERHRFYKDKKHYLIGPIFILRKSSEVKIVKINNKQQILSFMFTQLWSKTQKPKKKQINTIINLVKTNDFYFLFFNNKNNSQLVQALSKLKPS